MKATALKTTAPGLAGMLRKIKTEKPVNLSVTETPVYSGKNLKPPGKAGGEKF